jgi:hypothetical protein
MDIIKGIGYIFLSIMAITVTFFGGLIATFLGFFFWVISIGVLFIGFVAYFIKNIFESRK